MVDITQIRRAMFVFHEPLRNRPKSRVQLHIHLDGSVRYETIWELMRQKGLPLPGDGSLHDLKDAVTVKEPRDLLYFLRGFGLYLPAIQGDLSAIERISYEFVEDQARDAVLYCEARFCPQLFLPQALSEDDSDALNVTADDVLLAVLLGLSKGEKKFGTKVRVILCCILGHPEWSSELLRLCEEYRNKGVVGIDIAGDESEMTRQLSEYGGDGIGQELQVFSKAKEKGVHRTVHAGEAGGPNSVKTAIERLHAERIGHGYRVVEDESILLESIERNIHFEVCPYSSYLTGSVKGLLLESKRHPLLRFTEEGVSFSISTDDTTITGTKLEDEYDLVKSWGCTEAVITRSNFQAALHSFLPPEEKKELIDKLKEVYGVLDYSPPPAASGETVVEERPAVTIASWSERS